MSACVVRLFAPGSEFDGREMTVERSRPIVVCDLLAAPSVSAYDYDVTEAPINVRYREFVASGFTAPDGVAVWHERGGPQFDPPDGL